jgi:hypothetical protein
MEDYNSNLLNDSKNEWSIRLMNIICGHIIDGFRSIFNEAIELCEKNDEPEKYLMTFQNFLSRIPKWNQTLIDEEHNRIKELSKCDYLDDLVTCVHVIQLKILSCVRTSNQNKKIDINIPEFNSFLHNVYINIARKLYSNIYLFQIDITPLEQQKNNREFEVIVQSCIMNTIRDNIPVDDLLKQYIDETQEVDIIKKERVVKHEVKEVKPEATETNPTESNPTETNNNESNNSESNNSESNNSESNNSESEKQEITFNEVVEKYDPINNEKSNQPINFEPRDEPEIFDNPDTITIGEDISLDLNDSNLENLNSKNNEIIDLGIQEINV